MQGRAVTDKKTPRFTWKGYIINAIVAGLIVILPLGLLFLVLQFILGIAANLLQPLTGLLGTGFAKTSSFGKSEQRTPYYLPRAPKINTAPAINGSKCRRLSLNLTAMDGACESIAAAAVLSA